MAVLNCSACIHMRICGYVNFFCSAEGNTKYFNFQLQFLVLSRLNEFITL